ncbi:MAG: hypothetical protein IPJ74_05220 [Saprospiraceae bacterium]|nr:hypothetical protein [Saprospiraceae bacterium]
MSKKINVRIGILALMVFAAALSRLLPHPYNFTPIGAMSLFGAAYFSKRWLAFAVPFLAMWVSDLILDNVVYSQYYDGFQWFGHTWVYISFALIVVLGFMLLRKLNITNVILASLSASAIFFLVTNFAVWLGSPAYPQNFIGLMSCYAAGLPFYSMDASPPLGFLLNGVLGDLFYCGVLFGVFEWVKMRFPALKIA